MIDYWAYLFKATIWKALKVIDEQKDELVKKGDTIEKLRLEIQQLKVQLENN